MGRELLLQRLKIRLRNSITDQLQILRTRRQVMVQQRCRMHAGFRPNNGDCFRQVCPVYAFTDAARATPAGERFVFDVGHGDSQGGSHGRCWWG